MHTYFPVSFGPRLNDTQDQFLVEFSDGSASAFTLTLDASDCKASIEDQVLVRPPKAGLELSQGEASTEELCKNNLWVLHEFLAFVFHSRKGFGEAEDEAMQQASVTAEELMLQVLPAALPPPQQELGEGPLVLACQFVKAEQVPSDVPLVLACEDKADAKFLLVELMSIFKSRVL